MCYRKNYLILLATYGYEVFLSDSTPMYRDNKSVIQISRNPIFYERTKHIDIACYHLEEDIITLPFHSSSMQIANLFTTSHLVSRFCFLVGELPILMVAAL